MHSRFCRNIEWPVLALSTGAGAQQVDSCTSLTNSKTPGVEISKAALIAAGTTKPNPLGPGHSTPFLHIAGSRA
jgi:hypothetical protein